MTTATSRSGRFPTTDWQEIEQTLEELGSTSPSMDQLVRRYQTPLRRLLARRGVRLQDIDDVLQGFLMDKVLTGKVLRRCNPAKGRFRSYLAKSLVNYVLTEARKVSSERKQWARHVQVDDLQVPDKAAGKEDFDLEWARQVIVNARDLMRRQCVSIGRLDLWDIFHGRLLRPAYEDGEPVPYQQLMEQHQVDGLTSTFNLLMTAKRMYRRCIQQTVAEYTDDVDLEMKKLLRVFNRRAKPR